MSKGRRKKDIRGILRQMVLAYDLDGMVDDDILEDEVNYWFSMLVEAGLGDPRLRPVSHTRLKRGDVSPHPEKVKADIRARLYNIGGVQTQ